MQRLYKIITLCIVLLILLVIFLVITKREEGAWSEKADFILRKNNLDVLHENVVQFQEKEPDFNKLNLYNVYIKQQDFLDINNFIIAPFDPTLNAKIIVDNISDRNNFYKICQYRLIKGDLGWWAIVELEYGAKGKFF